MIIPICRPIAFKRICALVLTYIRPSRSPNVTSLNGSILIGKAVDGSHTAMLRAPKGEITIGEKVAGGASITWSAQSSTCPNTGGATRVSGSSSGRVHRRHPPQFKFAVAILITAETKREDHHHQHAEQQERIPHSVPLPPRYGGKPRQR